MRNAERYSFITFDNSQGEASFRPYLSLQLTYGERSLSTSGLLDTGAAINVMPYQMGVDLGAVWEDATTRLELTGNLAQFEARVLLVMVTVAKFQPARCVFAWTKSTQVPLLLGQANFFMEFDVCFYRSQRSFEVCPKGQ